MSRSKFARPVFTSGEPAAIAERLQLRVEATHVYSDNSRSAWQRKRPGLEEMPRAMGDGEIRHVIVYHPDRLMRQPKDLEELLSIADDKRVLLHGEANRRDLSDPDDRFILRIGGIWTVSHPRA